MALLVCQSCTEVLSNGETEDAEYTPLSTLELDEGESLVVDLESGEFRDWVSCYSCPQDKAGEYYEAEVLGDSD